MGYVIFQSRRENREISHDFLFDEDENDETLSTLLMWDSVILTQEISESEYKSMSQQSLPGVRVRRKVETPSIVGQGYEADIEFTVVKRCHQILPDWMNEARGYRLSNTTVYLQAASDEGEELFGSIQSMNASKLDASA